MKMLAIIIKEGFAVIVALCYNICLFKNPVITILKIVGCEDCEPENKLPLWMLGDCRWAILAIFFEKNSRFNTIWITYSTF